MTGNRTLAALLTPVALGLTLAACGGETSGGAEPATTGPAQSSVTEPVTADSTTAEAPSQTEPAPAGLPAAVAGTRDAIVAAAHARDYAALESLLDPATFSYSFGESGDPVGYWQTLEEEGEVPILGDFLPVVLSWPVGWDGGAYVWPAAHAKPAAEWTEDDVAPLRQLYTEEEIEGFRQAGGYLGYRAGIREDGTWIFFVAGD